MKDILIFVAIILIQLWASLELLGQAHIVWALLFWLLGLVPGAWWWTKKISKNINSLKSHFKNNGEKPIG